MAVYKIKRTRAPCPSPTGLAPTPDRSFSLEDKRTVPLSSDPARREQIKQGELERIVALFRRGPEPEERITVSELARIAAIAVPFRTNRERILGRDDRPVLYPRALLCGDRERKKGLSACGVPPAGRRDRVDCGYGMGRPVGEFGGSI